MPEPPGSWEFCTECSWHGKWSFKMATYNPITTWDPHMLGEREPKHMDLKPLEVPEGVVIGLRCRFWFFKWLNLFEKKLDFLSTLWLSEENPYILRHLLSFVLQPRIPNTFVRFSTLGAQKYPAPQIIHYDEFLHKIQSIAGSLTFRNANWLIAEMFGNLGWVFWVFHQLHLKHKRPRMRCLRVAAILHACS